ncbi:MAG TPA: TetR/AcrR family transcriptional regulator [Bradyrhizobium sp.]|nr:TetR/AcrR family transcriptional regulator [Bradyrhizobium sp.]
MTTSKTETGTEDAACVTRRGRGRPQARSDEETRTIIFDAARREFAAHGYAATNMESVARASGISTKTLYRLIPNKAALFEAMITERIDRFTAVVRLRACEGGDVEAALRDALMVCGELILDPDVIAMQQMILSESDKFPDIAETFFHKAIMPTQDTLASWLRAQAKRGLLVVEDAAAAAGMLLGMLAFQPQRAVMYGHAPAPTREQLEQRVAVCARLFLKGCGR